MSYRVDFTPSAARTFKKLPPQLQSRLAPKIDALSLNPRPHGVEKLAGQDGRYRLRVGNHRVIYIIADALRVVTIALIGHRREVYR
ncbi:MAG: type II toxin-antitoxin system RelE/ParE family toxin [Elusimicrobia bacterium]|nr:type II toxin-antitoxin system RelE/ParE family toxin [Elusimicrobiota bacterium]